MSYRKALERLRAYKPERLISGEYQVDDDCCALGALIPFTWDSPRTPEGETYDIRTLAKSAMTVVRSIDALDMTLTEAQHLQDVNDCFIGSEEERYACVLAWLEARVAEEVAT